MKLARKNTFFTLGLKQSLASLFICFLLFTATTSFAASLTKADIIKDRVKIDLVLSLDRPINYQVFYLANPARLVIDLKDTALAAIVTKSLYTNTPIRNIRIGKYKDKLRIVVDLNNKLAFNHFFKKNNLIIELFLNQEKSKLVLQPYLLPALPVKITTAASSSTPRSSTAVAPQQKMAETPITLIKPKNDLHPSSFLVITKEKPKIKISEDIKTPTIAVVPSIKKISVVQRLYTKILSFDYKLFLTTQLIAAPKLIPARDIIIVIDPGHGGKDPGVVGKDQTKEKDVVLAIAKDLQVLLNQEQGFKVLLTRDGDYFLALRERLQLARANKADLFISIHADTYHGSDYKGGVTVFALSQHGASSAAARWLAEKENASELADSASQESFNLRSLLVKLAQNESIAASLSAGDAILKRLANVTYLHKREVEQASFIVLKSPDIPSLLIESGFISDANEEKKLKDPQYQAKLAYAIILGIKDYFAAHPIGKNNNR